MRIARINTTEKVENGDAQDLCLLDPIIADGASSADMGLRTDCLGRGKLLRKGAVCAV